MAWTYHQGSGSLIAADGFLLAKGYSGAEPSGKNTPLMQAIADKGPIPQGTYTMDEPITTTETGPYSIPLIPDPGNEMFGRSNFLIHGDSISDPGCASKGCVILPLFARERIWESGDHSLQVVG